MHSKKKQKTNRHIIVGHFIYHRLIDKLLNKHLNK